MIFAAACSGSPAEEPTTPNGSPDSGAVADSGFFDASAFDAGSIMDAGTTPEADAGMADAGMTGGGLCPPEAGPTGSRVGDLIPNLELRDCDGNLFNVHELCAARASHLFIMAGW